MKKNLLLLKMIIIFVFSPCAFAGGGPPVPVQALESTQILNKVALVDQLKEQTLTAERALSMANDMAKQARSIGDHQWTSVSSDLGKLANIVRQGQSLAFSAENIDADFKRKYPGYKPTTNYTEDYKKLSDGTLDSIKVALAATGLQNSNFSDEERTIAALRQMGSSSQGRMQALQVGNMIAVEQVAQNQKLRALIMSQAQAQNTYMAAQQQDQASTRAAEDKFFKVKKGGPKKTYLEF